MKKVAFLTTVIIVLAASLVSAEPDLTDWLPQAQATAGNVTADATSWTFDGTAGVPYDYGTLGGSEASVEYIFNLSDSGVSVALGSVYGWGEERNTYKLEQWNDQGIFGITLEGYYDETYPGIASTFDVDTHVVFVNLPNGTQELYINGVSQGIDTRGSGWYTGGGEGFLGQTSWGADYPIGSIYGVASYNRALTVTEVSALYDAYILVAPGRAGSPSPANVESAVCIKPVLSWEPGAYPTKHDVYFSTDETKVTDAHRDNTLGVLVSQDQDMSYYPASGALTLDLDTTYYWRIDEVNTSPDHTIHQGSVWRFTTQPFAYPISAVTATADSNDADRGPEKTLDMVGDLHSTGQAEMWLSTAGAGAWIEYDLAQVYKLHEMKVWNHNTEFEALLQFGVQNATITYSVDGFSYDTLGATHNFNQAPGEVDYQANTTVDLEGISAQYVRITVNSTFGGPKAGLSEIRFSFVPVQARAPYSPISGAENVPLDAVLSWTAAPNVATHELFISTNPGEVANETISPISIPAGEGCQENFAPSLEMGKIYYWKVNEVNMAEEPNTYEGEIWSFSTPEYVLVEGFESYDDTLENAVFATWPDGYNVTDNGSQIGYFSPTYLEGTDPVHGGSWSAPLYYNNAGTVVNSEATRTFDSPQNWAVDGIKALTLFFYGQSTNIAPSTGEQMYVKLNGAKVTYDGDMADITEEQWHQWDIDLAAFGINLSSVTTISIGFDRGVIDASGMVFFDDIGLYSSRCMVSRLQSTGDLNDDCRVNHTEVGIISDNWLVSVYEVTPAAPDNANLVGHWTFDNPLDLGADSTGNNNGTVNGNATQSASAKVGAGALALDGDGDFIDVGGGPFFSALDDNGDGFTVSAWVQLVHTTEFSLMRIFSTDASAWPSGQGWGFGFIQPPARLRFTTFGILDYDAGPWMSSYLPDNSQWIHVAAVYKSDGDVDFYVDGIWIETVAGDFSLTDTDAGIGFLIGGLGTSEWFEGLIDDLRIYNAELPQGQVAWLANQTLPYIQDISPLLTPQNPNIDWNSDGTINFGDFAGLMQQWLDVLLWP